MTNKLANKTAIITGGGSGIGKSVCERLAGEGANIIIIDIDDTAAVEVAQELTAQSLSAEAHICDISNSADVAQLFESLIGHHDVEILVNSAGVAHIGNLENTDSKDLDRLYNINVKGVYNTMFAVIEHFKSRKSGVILNMASVAASVGIADRFAYSMTKGAVLTMTYSVAKDYIDYGIRCNCISPGRVHTPFVDNFLAKNYPSNQEEMFEQLSNSQPIGRMGTPEEIAALTAYLASDEAAFITGSNFPIDGGFVTLNN